MTSPTPFSRPRCSFWMMMKMMMMMMMMMTMMMCDDALRGNKGAPIKHPPPLLSLILRILSLTYNMTDAFKKWQAVKKKLQDEATMKKLQADMDEAATMKKWQDAESWIALVQLNREFILQSQAGEDVQTPYHDGPLCEETIELIPGLLRLHEYRLLTVCSQPMELKVLWDKESHMWIESKQVPFVEFLIPYEGETTKAFISNLIKDSQLITHVCDDRNNFWPDSNAVEIVVTMSRESTSYDALLRTEWDTWTYVNPHVGFDGVILEAVEAVQDANLLFCSVVTFENINLLERVESHAINAGLERTSFDTGIRSRL